jgi:hypothetical protein
MLEQKLSYESEPPKKRSWLRNLVLYGAIGLAGLIGGCEGCGEDFAFRKAKEGAKVVDVKSNFDIATTLREINSYVALPRGKYFVDSDIIIREGGILEIEPGTELYFGNKGGISCKGILRAIGTEKKKIVFSSMSEELLRDKGTVMLSSSENRWTNIFIEGEKASDSTLEYCIVRMGSGRRKPHDFDAKYNVGGGVLILSSNPIIRHCEIENNKAEQGGGVYSVFSNAILDGNVIAFNSAAEGGGIYVQQESSTPNTNGEKRPALIRNLIRNNNSESSGGGVAIFASDVVLSENTICGNRITDVRSANGASIDVDDSPYGASSSKPLIERNKISDNWCVEDKEKGKFLKKNKISVPNRINAILKDNYIEDD